MLLKICLISACLCFGYVWSFSTGAPPEVCEDMTPQHKVEPQTTPFPYDVILSENRVRAGDSVTITITGKGRRPLLFKGFTIQCRVNNTPVGQFSGNNIKLVNCSGSTFNAATHQNAQEKSSITLNWTSPPQLRGTVVCLTTVAKNGGEFWVAQRAEPISVV